MSRGKNPARIIVDTKLKIPLRARVLENAKCIRTIIVTSDKADVTKLKDLRKRNIEFIIAPTLRGGDIDLIKVIGILYKKGIKKLLAEGGSRIITSFLKLGIVDTIVAIISPKIMGKGIDTVQDLGVVNLKKALRLKLNKIEKIGGDIVYIAQIK